jgi:Family of unknown function (DUF6307)
MTTAPIILSQYERRLKTVTDIIRDRSSLDGAAAGELAAQVLHVLDTIPEKVR